jgi:isochorismate synthase EntC
MTELNFKDFLTCGAFLQTGPDLFKVLSGPFTKLSSDEVSNFQHSLLFYKPDFWDFLHIREGLYQDSVYSAVGVFDVTREELLHFIQSFDTRQPDIQWENVNETRFRTQFDWSQKCFADKSLVKTVPIIRQSGSTQFGPQNLLWCLQSLIQARNFGWSYGFFENGKGLIGHTPEILAQWNKIDRRLHTVALAGTYAKTPNAHDEILEDEKVLNEHQIVIDDINKKLAQLKFNLKIQQGPTDVLELRYLLHLMTEFELEVENKEQVFSVIKGLHPTSAMGLYPFDLFKMKDFSQFSLQKDRGVFASPFAMIEKGAVSCVVAIRNMFFSPDQVQIYSGAGVTSGSNYELELTELQNKRDSVKKMLGLKL